jgi:putative spermidine/putrescine transport system permease protein
LKSDRSLLIALLLPTTVVFVAFFVLPLANLFVIGGTGKMGWAAYSAVLTEPRYLSSLLATVALATVTTLATLVISGVAGVFLSRNRFRGRAVLTALLIGGLTAQPAAAPAPIPAA